MADFIDEYFVKPMQYPNDYAPYNVYNTAVYALIALISAYMIFKWLRKQKIPIDAGFYNAILPYIFIGGIMRVIQDAELLPRSLELSGITLYPFISPGIYAVMFVVLCCVYYVSKLAAKKDLKLLGKKIRDSGIGLGAALFSVLALWGFGRIGLQTVVQMVMILFFAALGLFIFEFIKTKFYNKRENAEFRNMERTTVLAQALDGAATFVGVSFANYSEQHVVANTIFSVFGSPLAFYLIKVIFAMAIIFVLRKEAENKEEQVFIMALVTIFGLAPGVRDALRLLFFV